jgi:hypothetical protein
VVNHTAQLQILNQGFSVCSPLIRFVLPVYIYCCIVTHSMLKSSYLIIRELALLTSLAFGCNYCWEHVFSEEHQIRR